MSRVSNYFSYDDVENSEIRGETLLQMSITNFKNEIDRLADTIPTTILDDNRKCLLLCGRWNNFAVSRTFADLCSNSTPQHPTPPYLDS